MVELILFILSGIGLTSIIVDSEFFARRKLNFQKNTEELEKKNGENDRIVNFRKSLIYLLNCYQCSGFWVGFILGAFFHPLAVSWYARPLECIMCGGVISFAAQLGMALFNYLNVSYGNEP